MQRLGHEPQFTICCIKVTTPRQHNELKKDYIYTDIQFLGFSLSFVSKIMLCKKKSNHSNFLIQEANKLTYHKHILFSFFYRYLFLFRAFSHQLFSPVWTRTEQLHRDFFCCSSLGSVPDELWSSLWCGHDPHQV